MPSERRIAIAILRPYREFIDRVLKPVQMTEATRAKVQESVKETIKIMEQDGVIIPEDLASDMETLIIEMNTSVSAMLMPLYFKLLGEMVDNVLAKTENRLLELFTPAELDELAELLDKECVKKLLGAMEMFDILTQERHSMKDSMQEAVFSFIEKKGFNEQMKSIYSQINWHGDTGFGFGFGFQGSDEDPPF